VTAAVVVFLVVLVVGLVAGLYWIWNVTLAPWWEYRAARAGRRLADAQRRQIEAELRRRQQQPPPDQQSRS
jgi:uncharacterized membrane protein